MHKIVSGRVDDLDVQGYPRLTRPESGPVGPPGDATQE